MSKCYSELVKLPTFKQRFEYLKLSGGIGTDTFGFDRYLNQAFYTSDEWKRLRRDIILRDNGCDLGLDGYTIFGKVLVHHMNPITKADVLSHANILLNPEYLICVSHNTHNAIHYGSYDILDKDPIVRTKNDTCPWKR